jgi:putative hydrolase of the HAD superfamily
MSPAVNLVVADGAPAKPVIVFDLDDTLFPEHSYVRSGFKAVEDSLARKKGIQGFRDVAERLFQARIRGSIFDQALIELGYHPEASLIKELVDVYRGHRPEIQFFPDAEWALSYYGAMNQVGVITDGYLVAQQKKAEALRLTEKVDVIIFSDAYGREHWKPSKTPYLELVRALNCEHSDCVYISDNPKKDFITARSLGWRTIRIKRPEGEYRNVHCEPGYNADIEIDSLFELKNHVHP